MQGLVVMAVVVGAVLLGGLWVLNQSRGAGRRNDVTPALLAGLQYTVPGKSFTLSPPDKLESAEGSPVAYRALILCDGKPFLAWLPGQVGDREFALIELVEACKRVQGLRFILLTDPNSERAWVLRRDAGNWQSIRSSQREVVSVILEHGSL